MNRSKPERTCRFMLAVVYIAIIALGLSRFAAADQTADLTAASHCLPGSPSAPAVVPVGCDDTGVCWSQVWFTQAGPELVRVHLVFPRFADEHGLDIMLSGAVREFGAEMQMRWLTDPGGRIAAYCVADISERALRADLNCGTESYVGRIVSVYRHMTGSRGFVSR